MGLHLKIIGWLLLILSLTHVGFPLYFHWRKDLAPLSQINRQMMHVHTFFIALVVFLTGLCCITCTDELIYTPLGKKICLGLGVFWGTRLVFQFAVYSPQLWRGKAFETTIHCVFSLLWLYMTAVFFRVYVQGIP
jgi:hypothetical protein